MGSYLHGGRCSGGNELHQQRSQGVDETNSDVDPTTGMTDVFSIGYAEENLKLDAGLYGDPVLPDFGELETQVNVITCD